MIIYVGPSIANLNVLISVGETNIVGPLDLQIFCMISVTWAKIRSCAPQKLLRNF